MTVNDKTTKECNQACRELGEYLTADMTGLDSRTLLTLIGEINIRIDTFQKPIAIELSDINFDELLSFSLNDLVKEHINELLPLKNSDNPKFYVSKLNQFAAQFEAIAKKYRSAANRV